MENFQQHITDELVKAVNSLTAATTPVEYAQASYDHYANLINICNTANEGGQQITEAPGVPA